MLTFIHIPKTAGTTLHKILAHRYARDKTVLRRDAGNNITKEEVNRWGTESIKLVMGHQRVGAHKFNKQIRYITCVRNPVSRVYSLYKYAKSTPGHYLYEELQENNMSLIDFLEYERAFEEASNGMTRILAGVDHARLKLDKADLEKAKQNIRDYFDVVLTTESFDEDLTYNANKMSWGEPYYIRRRVGKNKSKADSLGEDEKLKIKELNPLDFELFEWIIKRKEAQQGKSELLPEMTKKFRRKNERIGKFFFLLRELKLRLSKPSRLATH